jgi:hypothetical protein
MADASSRSGAPRELMASASGLYAALRAAVWGATDEAVVVWWRYRQQGCGDQRRVQGSVQWIYMD